jgi:hypothetical protein
MKLFFPVVKLAHSRAVAKPVDDVERKIYVHLRYHVIRLTKDSLVNSPLRGAEPTGTGPGRTLVISLTR